MNRPALVGQALAGGLALAVALAGPPPLAGQTPTSEEVTRRAEVRALYIIGNQALSAGQLRAVIRTRDTECKSLLLQLPFCLLRHVGVDVGFAQNRAYLDTLAVAEDAIRLRAYYNRRGYYEAQVDREIRSDGREARVWFTIDEGPPTLIDSLVIRGLPETLPPEQASAFLGLAEGDPLDRIRLQVGKDSLVRILRRQGYIEALVLEGGSRVYGGPARVEVDVHPGPRFRVGEVRIEGAEAFGEKVVRDLFPLAPGQYYNQEVEQEGQRNLFGLEAVRFASIRQEDPSPPDGTGPDGAAPARAAADSTIDLVVQITPAAPRAARGGVGWSTDACVQAESQLTHRNLLGGARRLQLTAQLSNLFAGELGGAFPCSDVGTGAEFRKLNFLLQTELILPVVFSGENSLRARLFIERETIPDVFIQEALGAEIGITRRLSRTMTATLSYSPTYTGFGEQSADIFFCVNFGFCEVEDIVTVSRSRRLAPLTLGWVWNRTDDPLRPTRGFYVTAEGEVAARSTGSQYKYLRIVGQAAGFFELEPGLVVAARARSGIVRFPGTRIFTAGASRADRLVHPSRRFFVGGSQSVRGFGQNLLGPRVLVADATEDCPGGDFEACVQRLATEDPGAFDQRPRGGDAGLDISLELRRYLSPQWGLVFFADAGSVSQNLTELKNVAWTPGMGLRFTSPIGSIRLDVGYNTTYAAELPAIVSLQDGTLMQMEELVRFDPFRFDDPGPLREIWRRFQIHISIGEAF